MRALEGLLIALSVYLLVCMAGNLRREFVLPVANISADLIISEAKQSATAQLSSNWQFDPFYRYASQVGQTAMSETLSATANDTELSMKLVGVITNFSAMIEMNSVQNSILIGEEIQTGISLISIHKNHVLLNNNGQIERLGFEKLERTKPLPQDEIIETIAAPDVPLEPDIQPGATKLDRWITFEDKAWDARKLVPLKVVERTETQPVYTRDFSKAVSINRVDEDGKTLGYALNVRDVNFDLRSTGFRDKIGKDDLREGKARLGFVTSELSRRKKPQFTVLRNGQEVELTVGGQVN